jgi:hypothetical protein
VLPWLVLQRFGYRQLMYYIVLKASLTAGRCVPIPPCPQAVYWLPPHCADFICGA